MTQRTASEIASAEQARVVAVARSDEIEKYTVSRTHAGISITPAVLPGEGFVVGRRYVLKISKARIETATVVMHWIPPSGPPPPGETVVLNSPDPVIELIVPANRAGQTVRFEVIVKNPAVPGFHENIGYTANITHYSRTIDMADTVGIIASVIAAIVFVGIMSYILYVTVHGG